MRGDAAGDLDRVIRRHRLLLIAIFLLTLPVVTPYLRGDGIAYYAYVASTVIDHDLQFENEYRRSDPARCARYFGEDGKPLPELWTPTGHLENYHTSGPSLLWSPFFVVAHAGVTLHNALVAPEHAIEADGYSRPYLLLCALGSAFYAFAGLLFAHAIAARVAGAWGALFATLGLWFGGNLIVYQYLLPFLSHPASVFVESAFLWVWWRTARDPSELPTVRSIPAWFALGTLCGLGFSTYYVGSLFGIFVLLDAGIAIRAWVRSGAGPADLAGNTARIAIPGLAGLVIGFLPHAIPKWILYGSPLALGYDTLAWQPQHPFLFEVLFSSHRGLLTWHPIYLFALVGLAMLAPRAPRLAWGSIIAFGACTYMIASKPNWHGGSAFGNRYFLVLTPIFLIGLATFLEGAAGALGRRLAGGIRSARWVLVGMLVLLAIWNAGFLLQWATNLIPNRGPISFREVAVNQVTAVPTKLVRVALPFLTDRGKVVKRIETEDLQEVESAEHSFGVLHGVCRPPER